MLDYRSLIMDVDGVIFDSNHIKEENIRRVASNFLSSSQLKEFVEFFVSGNGIPRENKIAAYFGKDTPQYFKLLSAYNQLNSNTLINAPLTFKAKEFLDAHYSTMNIWAVSGGAEDEVKELFTTHHLNNYFKGIHGGPTKKKAHLDAINPEKPITYIGDSKVDHESANHIGADFIFMYQYTQFDNWEQYFRQFPEVRIVRNLSEL